MTACPSDEDLARFLSGDTSVEHAVEGHLAECLACRALVRAAAKGGESVPAPDAGLIQPTLGRYDITEQIGVGGQSIVWQAYDHLLHRQIALKVSSLEANANQRARQRFLREARITAELQHPNIIPIYEIGENSDGVLYYSMRRVGGETLASHLAHPLSLKERLRLLKHVVDLCQALAYAHRKGYVHRDLKPHNIMIGEFGETIVLDWGLAKGPTREPPGTDNQDVHIGEGSYEELLDQALTRVGSSLGTPAYMSPEQVRGQLDIIDQKTDVWCLGAVLFHVLTGRAPYEGASAEEVLEQAQKGHRPELRELTPHAPSDLSAICERAMANDRSERYPDAAALAADLERFFAGGLVLAYDYASWERLRLFARAHKAAVVAAALISAAVVAALIVVSLAFSQEADARRRALVAARIAQDASDKAGTALAYAHLDRAEQLTRDGLFLQAQLHGRAARLARVADETSSDLDMRRRLRSLILQAAQQPLERFAGHTPGSGQGASMSILAMSSSGDTVYCSDGDSIRIIASRDHSLIKVIKLGGRTRALTVSGEHLLVGTEHGGVEVRSSQGELINALTAGDAATTLVTSSASGHIAIGDTQGAIWIHSPGDDTPKRILAHEGGVIAASFSANGTTLATGGSDNLVRTFDVASGRRLREYRSHTQWVTGVRFVGDSQELLTSSSDRTLQVHRGEYSRVLHAPQAAADALVADERGRRIAVGYGNGRVQLFGADLQAVAAVDTGESVHSLALSPSGEELVVAASGCSLRWWHLRPIREIYVQAEVGYQLAVAPDENTLVVPRFDEFVTLWNLDDLTTRDIDTGNTATETSQLTRSGQLLSMSQQGVVELRDPTSGDLIARGGEGMTSIAIGSGANQQHFLGSTDGSVWSWRLPAAPQKLVTMTSSIASLAVSPRGHVLALATSEGELAILNLQTMAIIASVSSGDRWRHIEFSHDGQQLVAAGKNRVALFDPNSLEQRHSFDHAGTWANVARFGNDDRWLLTASFDGILRIWDIASGELLATIPALSPVIAVDPKGRWWSLAQERIVGLFPAPWITLANEASAFDDAETRAGRRLDGFVLHWLSTTP